MSSTQQLVALVGGIVGGVTTLVVTFVTVLNYLLERRKTDQASHARLSTDQATRQLAKAVERQWYDEEVRRRILDPFPLPVRWGNAQEQLFDHWSNILRAPSGTPSFPLDLSGRFEEMFEIFRQIPSRRLLILGEAGSGKTILAMQFVLDYISRRGEDDPVPVIFGLESWDPTKISLDDWLTSRLISDYPALGEPTLDEPTIAAYLVSTGRILPVLDGFDEIARGLRTAALEILNAMRSSLLITSRPAEYATAVDEADILTGAAAINLSRLTIDDLAEYLPRTTRKSLTGSARTATRWDEVIAQLGHPGTPEERIAAEVLSVPLMVGLARVIYSESRSGDPAELLRPGLFTTREALEKHLLEAFVPAVYGHPQARPHGHVRRTWPADQALRWLENLALHLKALEKRDLAWWELRDTVPLPVRVVLGGLVGLVCAGLLLWPLWRSGAALGFGSGFGIGIATVRGGREPIRATLRLSGQGLRVTGMSLAGAAGGIAGGELGGFLTRSHGFAIKFLTGSARGFGTVSVTGLAIGFVVGLAIARVGSVRLVGTRSQLRQGKRYIPDWIMMPLKCAGLGFLAGLVGGAALSLTGGLALGAAGGAAAGLISGVETPVDIKAAPSPMDLLRADRAYAIFLTLLFGLTVGLSVGLVVWLVISPVMGLALGIGSGLVDGIGVALGFTAWGQWVVFTRGSLLLTKRLPPALPGFLVDAHKRGILRQAGATYQFRHALLQDHLAAKATRKP
jgi:hypothetical protein